MWQSEAALEIKVLQKFIKKRQKQPLEVFYKKSVLKISQNSQETTCARVSFLIKLQAKACYEVTEHIWATASPEITKYMVNI